ncbi:uncharacterized protein N7459_008828 [Penicillium hispanicum]|uniref:uncharacterized protein n=1 Tax=Penicillium hispanicum TaxID=1080232 RepID=UPI0025420E0D|nr:uncharacterized protein N7459_008828 [Penicillium hispanicum]KAJ5574401.1 hypothetical protein N7459_008828 [Penicillium hispanicum]
MDPFSHLPAPLPFQIIQHLGTFEDLDATIHASPDAFAAFQSRGPLILDAIASSVLNPELHNVLHSVARIHSQPVATSLTTLESFRQAYAGNLLDVDRRPGPFPRDAAPQVYVGLVRTAANIRRLAALVLAELLRRTSKLRIRHAVDRTIDFASGALPRVPGTNGWPRGQDVTAPQSLATRSPSWIEGYRIQRALWLIQLALDVRAHAPWLRWTASDTSDPASRSGRWPVSKLVAWLPSATDAPLVATVLEDVCAARGLLPTCGRSSTRTGLVSLERMPYYTGCSDPDCKLEDSSQDDAAGVSWSQDRGAAKRPADGRRILAQLISSRHVNPSAEVMHRIMESGLVIWDRKRLRDLGLMDEPGSPERGVKWWENEERRPQMSPDEIWYAWCSLDYDDAK